MIRVISTPYTRVRTPKGRPSGPKSRPQSHIAARFLLVMAHVVMAHAVIAHRVMAYVVVAHIVMAYVVVWPNVEAGVPRRSEEPC